MTNSIKTQSNVVSKISTGCGPSPERETETLVENFREPARVISESIEDPQSDKIKVSTGCGPSPPRDLPKTNQSSTGTSPPPQSISTQVLMKLISNFLISIHSSAQFQTYDTLPFHKEDDHSSDSRSSHVLRRSQSLASNNIRNIPYTAQLSRSASRQSFMSDMQVINIHMNLSGNKRAIYCDF